MRSRDGERGKCVAHDTSITYAHRPISISLPPSHPFSRGLKTVNNLAKWHNNLGRRESAKGYSSDKNGGRLRLHSADFISRVGRRGEIRARAAADTHSEPACGRRAGERTNDGMGIKICKEERERLVAESNVSKT